MASNHEYYKILDEIRISKSISVSELCDGITTERTYYRNLRGDCNIRFSTLARLIEKLNVSPYELIHFSVFVKKGDPGVSRFIYRVHTKLFFDIDDIYQQVKVQKYEHVTYQLLLETYIKKYEYMINKISKETYLKHLDDVMLKVKDESTKDIYFLSINTLYAIEKPNNAYFSLESISKWFLEYDFRLGVMFFMIGLDGLMESLLGQNIVSDDIYIALTSKFTEAMQFFSIKYFHMKLQLYKAYSNKVLNQQKEMEEILYQHLMSAIQLLGKDEIDFYFDRAKDIFHVEPNEFILNLTKEHLKNETLIPTKKS